MKKSIVLAALVASFSAVNAQEWLLAGNPAITAGTDFLGTTDNDPLDLRTNDIHRFRLLPDATYTIGTYTNQIKNGSLLLGPDLDDFFVGGFAPGPSAYSTSTGAPMWRRRVTGRGGMRA